MKPALLVACLTICFFPNISSAQQDRAEAAKIDRVVNEQMLANKIPGVSLAVLRKGKIVLLKSYGLANVEHQAPVKPETIFQSGSIGKQFTAAAVMILIQENKLSLDDRVSKYIPELPATWKDITNWHLLTHTSGLGDYPPEIDLKRDYTEDEFLAAFKKAPLDFEPGTSWNYSNVGYVTLGILIGKITGKFYGDFVKERLFQPLDMTTARIISEADIVPNRAAGYRLVKGELRTRNGFHHRQTPPPMVRTTFRFWISQSGTPGSTRINRSHNQLGKRSGHPQSFATARQKTTVSDGISETITATDWHFTVAPGKASKPSSFASSTPS